VNHPGFSIVGGAGGATTSRNLRPMRIHLSDPNLASDLLRFLQQRADAIGTKTAADELEVTILGSRRQPYNRLELDLRVRAWQAAHPHVVVDLID
jgi:hypothetical protein